MQALEIHTLILFLLFQATKQARGTIENPVAV